MSLQEVECGNGRTYFLDDDENGAYTVYGEDGLIIVHGEYSGAGLINAVISVNEVRIAETILDLFECMEEGR